GSDATLDNAHVMRLAGRFGRRIRGYAKANDIPVVNCSAGERKHDIAEDYLARTTINCFTNVSRAAALAKIAETLSEPRTIGRLSQLCDRWIYSACLCFALDLEEQRLSGFRYQYSNYQIEYSRNLIFEV